MLSRVAVGDYVLATKYWDGDPHDQYCVGFVKEIMYEYFPLRYNIVDNSGGSFRGNGFRRVCKISQVEGQLLLAKFPEIEAEKSKMIWEYLEEIRNEIGNEANND